MKGAGGTDGGIGRFFIGLCMTIGGTYLFLDAVQVTHHFGFGQRLYRMGNFHLTTGMVFIPLVFGVGFIFYLVYRIFIYPLVLHPPLFIY